MDQTMTNKLNMLIKSIKDSLSDIKRSGKKGKGLEKAVEDSRNVVTEVLEQQLGGISLEEQINISQIPDDDWIFTAQHIIDVINEPFVPVNRYDTYFLQLFNYLKNTDVDTLVNNMMFSLKKIEQEQPDSYELLLKTINKYDRDAIFDPEDEDFSFLEENHRIRMILYQNRRPKAQRPWHWRQVLHRQGYRHGLPHPPESCPDPKLPESLHPLQVLHQYSQRASAPQWILLYPPHYGDDWRYTAYGC